MKSLYIYNLIKKIKSYLSSEREGYFEFITNQDEDDIYGNMICFGWQYNYLDCRERREVLNLRKLYGMRQLHFRLYDDGMVYMTDEFNPEFYPIEYMSNEQVRQIDRATVEQIREMLKGYRVD